MRGIVPLLRIAVIAAILFALFSAIGQRGSTGMPDPDGMDPDALWWYIHRTDVIDVGIVLLLIALIAAFVPSLVLGLVAAFAIALYASVAGDHSPGLDGTGAWWVLAVALVLLSLVRRALRPTRVQTPPA